MSERHFTSQTPGPLVFGLSLPVGIAYVYSRPDVDTAWVRLHTDEAAGPASHAMTQASAFQNDQAFGIQVPSTTEEGAEQGGQVGQAFPSSEPIYGAVTGKVIEQEWTAPKSGAGRRCLRGITAAVVLPEGSSFAMVSASASAVTSGHLDRLEFRSVSGALDADGARVLTAATTSGPIWVGRVSQHIACRSVWGAIDVRLHVGNAADLGTVFGGITLRATPLATGSVYARSVSGAIRLSGTHRLAVDTHSALGYVAAR